MKTKPVILVFIDWFYPGYLAGGPVQSIVSLISYLKADVDFKIFTTNRDLNSKVPYKNIIANQWITSSLGCEVFYAVPDTLDRTLILKILTETSYTKIYINSFFSKYFSILPLQLIKTSTIQKEVILAPRGMLGAGALAIKKLKKKLFLFYSGLNRLHKHVMWHATSEQEALEIKRLFGSTTHIHTIANLPKNIKATNNKTKIKGRLNLFFSSRISQKKNLLFALNVLKEISSHQIHFSIFGLIEDEKYWDKCLQLIKTLPKNIQVEYKGTFHPDVIEQCYEQEQVLFLPTFNENYGHAIVESLLSGCPVIISDQTPWNDVEECDAGYAIPLNQKQKFIEAISAMASLNQEEFLIKSKLAIDYISKKIDLKTIVQHYKKLFDAN